MYEYMRKFWGETSPRRYRVMGRMLPPPAFGGTALPNHFIFNAPAGPRDTADAGPLLLLAHETGHLFVRGLAKSRRRWSVQQLVHGRVERVLRRVTRAPLWSGAARSGVAADEFSDAQLLHESAEKHARGLDRENESTDGWPGIHCVLRARPVVLGGHGRAYSCRQQWAPQSRQHHAPAHQTRSHTRRGWRREQRSETGRPTRVGSRRPNWLTRSRRRAERKSTGVRFSDRSWKDARARR